MSNENSQSSQLGTISFVFGIIVWFLWCGLYTVLGILAETGNLSEEAGYVGFIAGPMVLGVVTLLLGIPAVIIGLQSIRKKEPKRWLAISGLVLNFISLSPFFLIFILILAEGVSSLPYFIGQ